MILNYYHYYYYYNHFAAPWTLLDYPVEPVGYQKVKPIWIY